MFHEHDFEDEPTRIYSGAAGHEPEAVYRIALAADEIRAATFEQLLTIHERRWLPGSTYVLEPGTRQWRTLAEVLGSPVEEEEVEERADDSVLVAPQPVMPKPAYVPAPNASYPPPAVGPSAPSWPPQVRPTPSFAPQLVVPTPRRQPPTVAQAQAPLLTTSLAAPSVEPVEVDTDFFPRKKSSRVGVLILGFAALAGCGLMLQRNGVLFDWAKGQGLEATYLQLEQRLLGGPARETPRGLAKYLEQTRSPAAAALAVLPGSAPSETVDNADQALEDQTKTQPETQAEPATDESAAEPSANVPDDASAEADELNAPSEQTAEADAEPEPKADPKAEPKATSARVEATSGDPARHSAAANAAWASRNQAKSAKPAAKPRAKGVIPASKSTLDAAIRQAVNNGTRRKPKSKKPAGSEYDPLNASLD